MELSIEWMQISEGLMVLLTIDKIDGTINRIFVSSDRIDLIYRIDVTNNKIDKTIDKFD